MEAVHGWVQIFSGIAHSLHGLLNWKVDYKVGQFYISIYVTNNLTAQTEGIYETLTQNRKQTQP